MTGFYVLPMDNPTGVLTQNPKRPTPAPLIRHRILVILEGLQDVSVFQFGAEMQRNGNIHMGHLPLSFVRWGLHELHEYPFEVESQLD